MTNGDKIRSLTDEELAKIFHITFCSSCIAWKCNNCKGHYNTTDEECKNTFIKYFKQEFNEEEFNKYMEKFK